MAATRGNRKRASGRITDLAPTQDAAASGGGGTAPLLPDLLRRAVTAGLSSLFNTNEVVRRAVGEAMPREWVDFAVDQSERTRAEFIERLAGEVARTIENLELVEMAERLFEGRTIEIRAQVQLLPREGKVRTKRLELGLEPTTTRSKRK
jgi:hypothetical protein